jgi:endonuclease I
VYTFNNCAGAPDYLVSGTAVQSFTTLTGGGGIPAGYYDPATGLTCANLKTALRNIINTGLTPRTYSDLWTIYLTADVQPSELGGGNVIWDMYSDNPSAVDPYEFTPGTNQCGTYNSEADCYNREHSFPQSWFGGGTTPGPGTDYHHIFPTDGYVNGQRSNFPYGTVGSASFTSLNGSRLGTSNTSGISGTVFEPINEYKGDFARAFLYMVTCYQNNMTAWETEDPSGDVAMDGTAWPSVEPDYLLLMKAWHNSDPVSQKEIDRNNAGYGFQGNRNPYVDHPEYVGLVWPASCAALPVQLVSFDARYEREQVKLDWRISDAAGFSHFEIERSEDGGRTYVKAGQVVWNTARTLYTYIDNAAALQGNVLYRLKLVDIDGSHTYSKLVKVKLPALDGIGLLYPNPAKDKLVVAFRKPVMISYKAVITDLSGKIIFISPLAIGQSLYELPVNRLASGTYVLKLVSSVRSWQEKFVVQR